MLQFDEYKVKLNNLTPMLQELAQALDLEGAERELDMKLVRSTVGGRGGGGAALTGEGQRMLDAFDAFEAELKETAARLFPQYFQEFISPEEDHAC